VTAFLPRRKHAARFGRVAPRRSWLRTLSPSLKGPPGRGPLRATFALLLRTRWGSAFERVFRVNHAGVLVRFRRLEPTRELVEHFSRDLERALG
jgi:hypothetical protein